MPPAQNGGGERRARPGNPPPPLGVLAGCRWRGRGEEGPQPAQPVPKLVPFVGEGHPHLAGTGLGGAEGRLRAGRREAQPFSRIPARPNSAGLPRGPPRRSLCDYAEAPGQRRCLPRRCCPPRREKSPLSHPFVDFSSVTFLCCLPFFFFFNSYSWVRG